MSQTSESRGTRRNNELLDSAEEFAAGAGRLGYSLLSLGLQLLPAQSRTHMHRALRELSYAFVDLPGQFTAVAREAIDEWAAEEDGASGAAPSAGASAPMQRVRIADESAAVAAATAAPAPPTSTPGAAPGAATPSTAPSAAAGSATSSSALGATPPTAPAAKPSSTGTPAPAATSSAPSTSTSSTAASATSSTAASATSSTAASATSSAARSTPASAATSSAAPSTPASAASSTAAASGAPSAPTGGRAVPPAPGAAPAKGAPQGTTPLGAAVAARVASGVTIAHIEYNPAGSDVEGEFVLLRNTGAARVDLTGWTLRDSKANHVFIFPAFALAPGAEMKLWTRIGSNDSANLYWGQRSAIWNNTGDTGTLSDTAGVVISRFSYGGGK